MHRLIVARFWVWVIAGSNVVVWSGCGEGLHSDRRQPNQDASEGADEGASRSFRAGIGDSFDFAAARITVNAQTFDQDVRVDVRVVSPPRPGPVADVYEVRLQPVQRTHVPARLRLRLPAGASETELQLAYFKPKPSPSPGIWIPAKNPIFVADEAAWEADAPSFEDGVEWFALLRTCVDSQVCGPLLGCTSMLCQ